MAQVGEIARSLPYPAIEDGNSSYPNGAYVVEVSSQPDQVSVILNHAVRGAAFLERVISAGKAKYGCVVAVPLTGYRRLHLSDDARQKVEWESGVLGEPPMLRPVVVSVEEIACTLGPDDGVAEAWQGRELHIPKGARLALKNYLRPTSSLQHLLHVVRDQELPNGCFEVKPCDEEGFYFKIHTADDLFPFLQHAGESEAHRKSVLTHVASRCFEILARDYGRQDEEGEDGSKWESFRNLVALAGELQRQGLPIWDEDGFAADKVSTQLYPHSPPTESESE